MRRARFLSAFLIEEEGTASTFRGLREVFERHGLPLSLYTDRGANYFHTTEAGEKAGRAGLTQVGRALEHLGVHHMRPIPPGARPLGARLPDLAGSVTKELTLAGIATIEAANVFIPGRLHIPSHNARFAVPPEQAGSGFVAIPGVELAERFSAFRRSARSATTIACASRTSGQQIPESPLRAHFVKATVKVRQYPDGRHAIFYGKRCLGLEPPTRGSVKHDNALIYRGKSFR